MKLIYTYEYEEMREIIRRLRLAQEILVGDSELKIPGCKAAIDNAIYDLENPRDE